MKIMSDIIGYPGLMGLDAAELNFVLKGVKMIEVHMFEGGDIDSAAKKAIKPVIIKRGRSDPPVRGKKPLRRETALVNITGDKRFEIKQCTEIVGSIAARLSPKARIIWGARIDEKQKGLRVTVLIGWK